MRNQVGAELFICAVTEQVVDTEIDSYGAKCWKDMVGAGMRLGFLNLEKVKEEREEQWKQEKMKERKSKKKNVGRVLGKVKDRERKD